MPVVYQMILLNIAGDDVGVIVQRGTQGLRFIGFFPVLLEKGNDNREDGEYNEEVNEQLLFIG